MALPASQQLRLQLAQKLTAAVVGGPIPFSSELLDRVMGLSEAAETLQSNDAAWKDLAAYAVGIVNSIADLIGQVAGTSPETLKSNVAELKLTLEEISKLLLEMTGQGRMKARARAELNTALIARCRERLEESLRKFQLQAAINVQKALAEDKDMALIRSLPSVSIMWDPEKTCLRNTRASVIKRIIDWSSATGNMGENVFWLKGMAGRGKSTIAHSVGQQLHQRGLLLSCFFFKRDDVDRNNPKLVFSSLAKDLARQNLAFRSTIAEALRNDDKLGNSAPAMQFSELVSKPVKAFLASTPKDHIQTRIVIWDALDECQDSDALSVFLNVLKVGMPGLSPAIKFLVTSREIGTALNSMGSRNYSLDTSNEESEKDLTSYIKHTLKAIGWSKQLSEDWFSESDVLDLVDHAGGLFIWASTALKYIRHSINPKAQLHTLAQQKFPKAEGAPG